jgi:hypothetical protein
MLQGSMIGFVLFGFLACGSNDSKDGHEPGAGGGGDGATEQGGQAGSADQTGGQGQSGAMAGPWRPFSDDSPWNTPIAATASLAADSAELIADFETSSPYGEHLDVNIEGYSVPLYYADSSTPLYTVLSDVGGLGWLGNNGMDTTGTMPIPDGAEPDPQSDHHLLVVDREQMTEWGCWNMVREGTSWHAGLCATSDLAGTGVRVPANDNPTWYTSHGPRACGFPLVAGLIRTDEIETGRIDHALVVAYPHIRAGWYTPPASTAQATNGSGAQSDRGIPCGGRIRYRPEIDLDSLGVSRAGRIILAALQEYGAYVGDFSGAISLYADNSPQAQAYWQSIGFDTYELLDLIDLADFQVMELGTLYDNGNG